MPQDIFKDSGFICKAKLKVAEVVIILIMESSSSHCLLIE